MEPAPNSPEAGSAFPFARPVTCAQIRAFLAQIDTLIDPSTLRDHTPFTEAGADSLDLFNVLSAIQVATGVDIADQDIEKVSTPAGLAAYLNARMG
jgi:acyl carrier protein